MSLKLSRLLNHSRPLAKEQKIAEFRQHYVIFLTLWLCAGVFPSVLWIYLGRNSGAWPLESMGYLWLLGAAAIAYNKLYYLYEARLLHIYPAIQKFTKSHRRSFRFALGVCCAFPILHLSLIGLLWNKKRTRKESPVFLRHPLKTTFALSLLTVFLPLSLLVLRASPIQSYIPAVPNYMTYWISNGSTSALNTVLEDMGRTLFWMSETKRKIMNEKLDHAQANEIYAQKSNSNEVRSSPIAPVLLTFGSTSTHILAKKNSRYPSSESSNIGQIYIYESFVNAWKNWQPSLFYGLNPILLLNPVGANEFILTSLSIRYSTALMKDIYKTKTLEALEKLDEESARTPSAFTEKGKIKKLKRELETY